MNSLFKKAYNHIFETFKKKYDYSLNGIVKSFLSEDMMSIYIIINVINRIFIILDKKISL
jgi:hypothetical protein